MRARSTTLSLEPWFAPAPDSVDVHIEPDAAASGWVGRVAIAGTLTLERQVRGERCEDVVAALALITVLRLEGSEASSARNVSPEAAASASASGAARSGEASSARSTPTAPEPAPAPAPPAEPPRPEPRAPAAAAPEEPALPEPSTSESNAARAERDEEAAPPSVAEREPRRSTTDGEIASSDADAAASIDRSEPPSASAPWQWPSVRGAVAAQLGFATEPARALRAELEGELRLGEDMSAWAGRLSLALSRSTGDAEEARLGVTLLAAELGLCPPAFVDAAYLWVRWCAGVRAGRVHVIITPKDDSTISANSDAWRPWLAVVPSLSLGVPLSPRWTLRGELEVAVQLVRDRFNVRRSVGSAEPESLTVYRPDAASFELGLGIGYAF